MTAGVVLALAATALLNVGPTDSASASVLDEPFTPHPSLVPEVPETGYPIILTTPADGVNGNRQTRAVDLIGDYIVSGGDFYNIELQNGQTIDQRYLTIFDVSTKQIACTNLDVNNEVLAIAPGPDRNTAIIGGRFTTVNGADGVTRIKTKIAKIDLDTCEVDPNWTAGAINSRVTELAVRNNRLFVGGDFTSIGGTTIERLAEVELSTGTINPNFSFVFGGELSRTIVGMEVNTAGTRLAIVHRATSIAGNSMRGTAIFDVSNPIAPTLTDHRMSTAAIAYIYYNKIQDGAVSPDFSAIGVASGFATVADYVGLVPTTEAAGQLAWQHFMRDTNTGISISNNAVYVGGHFCKVDEGPGITVISAPNSGPSTCTGSRDYAGGAWRTQLAALNIADGTPLDWNPGNDSFRGATAVTVVSRGLLIGYDGDTTNNRRVGATAFFDFGAIPDPREDQTCTAVVDANFDVNLTWTAVPGGVDGDSYLVRRDGVLVADAGNTTTYTDSPENGTYTYRIRTAINGVDWDTTCDPTVTVDAPPPPGQTCSATEDNGLVTLNWTAIAGENNYIVRRNNSYVATAGNTLTFDDSPGNGTFTYLIRSKLAGVQTNTTCTPDITIDTPPPPGQTCSATEDNGLVTLNWTAIAGENNYIVRRNNSYVATAGNTLTFDDSPGNGTFTYLIRSKLAGVQTNTTCTPDITIDTPPPPGQTCTATVNGDGSVTLNWTAIAGELNYVVRRNNSWLTTLGNVLTYTDNVAGVGDTYVIRSSIGGVQTNTTCT